MRSKASVRSTFMNCLRLTLCNCNPTVQNTSSLWPPLSLKLYSQGHLPLTLDGEMSESMTFLVTLR